jgi:hypothetical protein
MDPEERPKCPGCKEFMGVDFDELTATPLYYCRNCNEWRSHETYIDQLAEQQLHE